MRVWSKSAAACALALGLACGCGLTVQGIVDVDQDAAVPPVTRPLDTSDATPTTTNPDGSTIVVGDASVDAGGDRPDATVIPTDCVAPDLFAFSGDATLRTTANGVVTLGLRSGKKAELQHTFDAKKPYSRSKVDLLLDVDWQNTWGGGGGDYTQFLREFFGPDDTPASHNDVVMAQNTLEAHIRPGSGTQGLGGMSVPKSKDVRVLLETTWSSTASGKLQVTMTQAASSAVKWTLDLPTAAPAANATTLTLIIGGTGNGTVADVTVAVRRACVYFDP